MLMQNIGVTNKEHYGMVWYFLEWSIRVAVFTRARFPALPVVSEGDSGQPKELLLGQYNLLESQGAEELCDLENS